MRYIAHTPPKDNPELKPHLYAEHIDEALGYGMGLCYYLLSFSNLGDSEREDLEKTLTAAIMLHDMGKLDDENQQVFRGEVTGRLPVDHIEAGVAVAADMKNELLGWLIRGHHSPGLPSKKSEKYFIKQLVRETNCQLPATCLRGLRHKRTKEDASHKEDYFKHFNIIENTNRKLESYKSRQIESCKQWPQLSLKLPSSGLTSRLMLSCLVDADHGSAAAYSKNVIMPKFSVANTQWAKRLELLNNYVSSLGEESFDTESKRNKLRGEFYRCCYSNELLDSKIVACSAPVGLGKTTSVMAYLLRRSICDGSSRIFVIAPFSNIIDQTVKVLRKTIVLEGEDAETIVAAHHHKAEFSDKNMRQYAASWQAPIVVTTAVQFFETIATAIPSNLRKLNAIVGASIFIDESHACLPVELLKITWHWLKKLSEEWSCNIVFSSGSMVEYWSDQYLIGDEIITLPDLLPEALRLKAQDAETARVNFDLVENSVNLNELIKLLQSKETWDGYVHVSKPSCLVIFNTVQSAAVVADTLSRALNDKEKSLRGKKVLHLSTALAPKDRAIILDEILRRQDNTEWDDQAWYLISTSCVEAGVDLDFAIGFREKCSVTSLLQVAGRINRHGMRLSGKLVSFSIVAENGLSHHPGFKESSIVFDDLWSEIVNPSYSISELCTIAIRKEFSRVKDKKKYLDTEINKKEYSDKLLEDELECNFQSVSKCYKVIDSSTATVIINAGLVEKLELGIPVNWQELQNNSVQLWANKITKFNLKPISGCVHDDIYSWTDTYDYDPQFLGIMAGIIDPEIFFKETGGVI